MKMIVIGQSIDDHESKYYVNPIHIESIYFSEDLGKTVIRTTTSEYYIDEDPENCSKIIEECFNEKR